MTIEKYEYDPEYVSRYFDDCGEKEWERLVQTPQDRISLHLHTEFLREHVEPEMKILEVGAAAGRFTRILTELNCRVTVTDLSEGQLALNRKKAEELGFASGIEGWHRLDMCDMACFPDEDFDAVVCYGGPLSYVFEKADQALGECCRVLKDGGIFFSSVMSVWGALHAFLSSVPDLTSDQIVTILESGDLTPYTDPDNKHHCHMFRSQEYRDLLERNHLHILDMSSANFLSINMGEQLEEIMEIPANWNELLRLEKEACRQPGCWDTGTHLIAVCRK